MMIESAQNPSRKNIVREIRVGDSAVDVVLRAISIIVA